MTITYFTSKETTVSTTLIPVASTSTVTRTQSLESANRIRTQRARFKAELIHVGGRDGRYILADAIDQMPDWLAAADVWTVVGWAPQERGGYRREPFVDQILTTVGVKSKRRLRELSDRQRGLVADLLRGIGANQKKAA